MLHDCQESRILKAFQVGEAMVNMSHLQYTDDIVEPLCGMEYFARIDWGVGCGLAILLKYVFARWLWRYTQEENPLWKKVISTFMELILTVE